MCCLVCREGREPPSDVDRKAMAKTVEPLFFFSLVWSVGASTDEKGRGVFDAWLRQEMVVLGSTCRFPKEGKVYDYVYDQVRHRTISRGLET